MKKPILCLDFDGVIHSYSSGWKGADVVSDPIVPGAIAFMLGALHNFDVVIFSSRSNQPGGIDAMRRWLKVQAGGCWRESPAGPGLEDVRFVTEKPPAMVGIDDRVLTFTGQWPDPKDLLSFQPWNKAAPAAPAGMAVPDLSARLAEAHDASLDDDHRACRAILTECIAALAASQPAGMAVPREPTQAEVSAVRMTSPSFITEAQARSVARAVLAASPSAQAAPARGAMTEAQIEELFQSVADADDEVHIRFARAIERFHGIGTTAPAGGEG